MAKDENVKNARRIDLEQLRDLYEQMAAGNNPITPDQLARFAKRPDGPIMPHGCVRSWQLRDAYGDNRGRIDESPVWDIVSREDGGCYILTSDGRDICVYDLETDSSFRLQSEKADSLLGCRARFLGVAQKGLPVTMVSHRSMIADADLTPAEQLDAQREGCLCIGPLPKSTQGVGTCAWLKGDQFVYEHCQYYANRTPSSLYLAQRMLLKETGLANEAATFRQPIGDRYKGFWLSPRDGVIAATVRQWISNVSLTVLNHDRSLRLPNRALCQGVVFTDDSVTSARLLVTDNHGKTSIHRWGEDDCLMEELPQLHPCVEDDAKFMLLPDQRLAYVAKRRHQKRSWVVGGKLQAGSFDLVSNIFSVADDSRCPGGPHYYGVAGRYIFLMKVV